MFSKKSCKVTVFFINGDYFSAISFFCHLLMVTVRGVPTF